MLRGPQRTGSGPESLIAECPDSATSDLSFPSQDPRTVFQCCPPFFWYLPQQGAMCSTLAFGKWLKSQTVAQWASSWALIREKRASLLMLKEKPPQSPCALALAPVLPPGPLWAHLHHRPGQL